MRRLKREQRLINNTLFTAGRHIQLQKVFLSEMYLLILHNSVMKTQSGMWGCTTLELESHLKKSYKPLQRFFCFSPDIGALKENRSLICVF